jgi:hypothetical protein
MAMKHPLKKQLNKPRHKTQTNNNKDSWAKFTYFGKETRFITKLFKETQIRIAYKVNNTISKRLTPKPWNSNPPQQQFEKSGIYRLTCPDCQMKYVGQTGGSLQKRYKEHFHDFKYNIHKSSFAAHLLDKLQEQKLDQNPRVGNRISHNTTACPRTRLRKNPSCPQSKTAV